MDWQQLDIKCWGTWHARNEAEATLLHITQCAVTNVSELGMHS